MSENKNLTHNSKKSFLQNPVEHIDITSFDARKIISSMEKMSFVSRETANAANIFNEMIQDKDCTIFLTLAGSTSAAGCMNIYKDLVKYNMVDAIIATGASIVDMDFFEALGFKHYQGSQFQDDTELRKNYIDRIYDTYIDEEELQECDQKICEIADTLDPRSYTSREFIYEMGKYLKKNSKKKDSLIETAYDNNVPIFCPAFTDSSAGFGLVTHQENNPKNHITIDSIRELRELTEIKIQSKGSGLFMIGGGVPKNFVQDTVICAELLGKEVEMHKYAVQITVADSRDGACSSSTLKEASSWGKVDIAISTLPQELASFNVELLQAPSLESATVICTAYLCISTSFPKSSAQITVSWTKFFGTPPPIINKPDPFDWIFISVNSRSSLIESIVIWFLGLFSWWVTNPKPALESVNAGQKMGTLLSYAVSIKESFFLEFFFKYFPIS